MFKEAPIARCLRLAFSGSLAGVALFAASAHAQEATQTAEKVEITGSAIKRVDAETALPVTIIKREDIERTGATTAEDLVNMIPGNFGGSTTTQNVGATGVAATAALRGLSSKYTLVLLNGRRVANYAMGNYPVDLNSIPVSAIERIEVLRDGASAIYGADAVAGVINFILRKDYQGLEASYYGTKTYDGKGNVRVDNITAGYGSLSKQGFNVLISANHEEQDVLHAADRSFANSAVRPDLGINKASSRDGESNLNFTDTNGNKYVGVNPYRYLGCNAPNDPGLVQIGSSTKCGTDYVKYIDLIPRQVHDNLLVRGALQINSDNQIYVEAVQTRDDMKSVYSPAPYTKTMVYPAGGRFYPSTITLPNGTVVTPTGPISGTWRTVAGGGRTDLTFTENDRFLLGGKGTIADWDYDTAYTYSKNRVEVSFGPGQFSYAKLTPLLSAGAINVFGPQDATSLAALNSALITGLENAAISTSHEIDVRASKELFQMPYGPFGLAVGVDSRIESLDQISEPVLASGDQVGGAGPIPTVTGSRKVLAYFAETSIPLYKNFDAQLAGRYDEYKNDFGVSFNKFSPKLSLTFKPVKEVLLRGSAAKGFRAPTLYENLRPFTSGNNTNGNWSDPIRCPGGVPITNTSNAVGQYQDECNIQQPTATEGNKNLKPEQSKQFSLGIVFQPTNNFSGSLDYWDIKISDAIEALSESAVFNDPVAYANYIYRYDPVNDPNQNNPIKGSTNKDFPIAYVYLPYFNTAKVFASGWDLNLNYKQKIEGIGTVGVNLDGTLYTKHGYQYDGASEVSDLGVYKDFGPTPRWRHALTLTWARGPWAASVTNNYTAGYKDYVDTSLLGTPNYPDNRDVSAYSTFDSQVLWTGIKNLDIAVGVKNLLNTDPPTSRTEINFQTGYDAQFSNPIGRTYYARLRYKFL